MGNVTYKIIYGTDFKWDSSKNEINVINLTI